MMEDYRRRLIISVILTIPILILSPLIQEWLDYSIDLPGALLLLFLLSTAVYLYGGWPFLKGLVDELRNRRPGMMLHNGRYRHRQARREKSLPTA